MENAETGRMSGLEDLLASLNIPLDDEPGPLEAAVIAAEKRIYWGRNKIGRLEYKLGGDAGKFFVLNTDDAELEGDALNAKIAENKAKFKELAVKVQGRATCLIELVSGKSVRLNPVMGVALRMLAAERKLVTGDHGNLYVRLRKAYSEGSARAMGNSTLGALRALEIIVPGTEKQTFVPNESSVFLALVSEEIGLNFVDVEASIAEEEARDAKRQEAAEAPVSNVDPTVTVEAAAGPSEPLPGASGDLGSLIDGIIGAAGEQELNEIEAALF